MALLLREVLGVIEGLAPVLSEAVGLSEAVLLPVRVALPVPLGVPLCEAPAEAVGLGVGLAVPGSPPAGASHCSVKEMGAPAACAAAGGSR